MIIRTISKQHTGGVMEKKDQPELMTDGRSCIFPVCKEPWARQVGIKLPLEVVSAARLLSR